MCVVSLSLCVMFAIFGNWKVLQTCFGLKECSIVCVPCCVHMCVVSLSLCVMFGWSPFLAVTMLVSM